MLLRTKSLCGITGIMAVLVALLIFFTQCTIELPSKEKEDTKLEEKPVEEKPKEIPFVFDYTENSFLYPTHDPNAHRLYQIYIYAIEGQTYIENKRFRISSNNNLDSSYPRHNFYPEVGVLYGKFGREGSILLEIWDDEIMYWYELVEGTETILRIEFTKYY